MQHTFSPTFARGNMAYPGSRSKMQGRTPANHTMEVIQNKITPSDNPAKPVNSPSVEVWAHRVWRGANSGIKVILARQMSKFKWFITYILMIQLYSIVVRYFILITTLSLIVPITVMMSSLTQSNNKTIFRYLCSVEQPSAIV